MRDLIRKLSQENPLWSAERIEDTLQLLGCDPPCSDTIRKYMSRPKTLPDKPTTWLPFLRNHLEVSWATRKFLDSCNIEEVRTAYRSPWQNPYIERLFGTFRRELLDHVIVLSERHLNRLLREYIEQYYHSARPHQGLDGDTPDNTRSPEVIDGPFKLISFPICGGLHHRYERVAA